MSFFSDRQDAGRRLAIALAPFARRDPVVLALPRGGVPVAAEIARALNAQLDVLVVRKVGVPGQPELGAGAVAEGGFVHLSQHVLDYVGLSRDDLGEAIADKHLEVERRTRQFRGDRPRTALRGRTVIVVDDGIATGGTIKAAIRSIKAQDAGAIILAVPVAAPDAIRSLAPVVDRLVCLHTPENLQSIGRWYEDFNQVPDEHVVELLERARTQRIRPDEGPIDTSMTIAVGALKLHADLTIPREVHGLVLFAHGSGSNRNSPRNQQVAQELNRRGLATLLLDLLSEDEQRRQSFDTSVRFDIPLLASRLGEVTDWVTNQRGTCHLQLGYFGSSTGAAAALIAAAHRPKLVRAIVSRSGRPDLADEALSHVSAPTLLIVGSADKEVMALNRGAQPQLKGPSQLSVIPNATHLFKEPGALEAAAALAGDWFLRHLSATEVSQALPA